MGQEERRRVRRTLEADVDRDRLWALIGDLDALGSWLGAEINLPQPPRPGDRGTFVMADGRVRAAQVETVAPGRRLVWRWSDDEGGWNVVTLLLDKIGPTRMRLTVIEEAEESYGRLIGPVGFTASAPAETGPPRWAVSGIGVEPAGSAAGGVP